MIRITEHISISESEIHMDFVRASGPGGQNINKVATAVCLQFNVFRCQSLPVEIRKRLIHLAGRKISADGMLTIQARRFRTQEANRRDAVDRLAALIRKACVRPRIRRPSHPSQGAIRRRLEEKRRRKTAKMRRLKVFSEEG